METVFELFKKFHLAVNQTDYVEHQKNMSQSCTWGTNLEIIVTATIFKMDVYVVSDTYRPGKATWLKYSPDRAAMLEIEKYSSILNFIKKFPTTRWLEISHICRCHFDSVKTNTVTPLNPPVLDGMIREEHMDYLVKLLYDINFSYPFMLERIFFIPLNK